MADPTPRDFFCPEGKKLKNLAFLGEIFPTQTTDGRPDPTQVKNFWLEPITNNWLDSFFVLSGGERNVLFSPVQDKLFTSPTHKW